VPLMLELAASFGLSGSSASPATFPPQLHACMRSPDAHPLDPPISLNVHTSRSVHPTSFSRIGDIVAIEGVVAGQVFKDRRTSL
jgi:hypothetical protein